MQESFLVVTVQWCVIISSLPPFSPFPPPPYPLPPLLPNSDKPHTYSFCGCWAPYLLSTQNTKKHYTPYSNYSTTSHTSLLYLVNPFVAKVAEQQLVARTPKLSRHSATWVSGVTKPLESFVNGTTHGPKVSKVTKTRPAFIWNWNLFVFVQFKLCFQYFSDLQKWISYFISELFLTKVKYSCSLQYGTNNEHDYGWLVTKYTHCWQWQ